MTFRTDYDNIFYVSRDGDCQGNVPCYSNIQAAIIEAGTFTAIRIEQGTYEEPNTLNAAKRLTLQGGWDTSFENQNGTTTLRQAPRVLQGSLSLQMLTIKPQ